MAEDYINLGDVLKKDREDKLKKKELKKEQAKNTFSGEQKRAFDLMCEGKNVFLSGAAGTGKSTLIKCFIECYEGNCAVVAPTGIAAVNVGGQTIHSFFALPIGLLTPSTLDALKWPTVKERIRQCNCIIVDEISMVRSDVFCAIDYRCRECAPGKLRHMPFGGKQLIVCGDFFQLPPIIHDEVEEQYLSENFAGEYAFCTKLWKDASFACVMLDKQFRQQNDSKFLDMLNKIRCGDIYAGVIDELNNECASADKLLKFAPVRLCTTNTRVKAINYDALAKIDAQSTTFTADIEGKFNESDYPTEEELVLKIGCRVMVLVNCKNTDGSFQYVNGDCGVVKKIEYFYGAPYAVVVKFDNGNECQIMQSTWSNTKYEVETDYFTNEKTIRQRVIGSFTQLPLKLAYAITIHKSQGMTLESIDLHLGNGCFAHGQLYTALSRARTLAGLKFRKPIQAADLILDKRVVDFYNDVARDLSTIE